MITVERISEYFKNFQDTMAQNTTTVNLTLIDSGFEIILDWLSLKTDVFNPDAQALIVSWYKVQQESMEPAYQTEDLADIIIAKLSRYLRTNHANAMCMKLRSDTETLNPDSTNLDAYLGWKEIRHRFFANDTVVVHGRRFEFYCRLVRYGKFGSAIQSINDLELMLSSLEPSEIKELIDECDRWTVEFLLMTESSELLPLIKKLVADHPGELTSLELVNLFNQRVPDNLAILTTQNEILCEMIISDSVRRKVHAILNTLENNREAVHVLNLTHEILLSQPGAKRNELLRNYQDYALKVQGSPSPLWQAVGVLMMALGANIIALGAISLVSGGVIPVVAGATTAALGLYSLWANRQRGCSEAMQDLMNINTDVVLMTGVPGAGQ